MKYNSRTLTGLSCLAIVSSFLLGSCTKKFEEYNTNAYGITNKDLSADYKLLGVPLQQVQQSIYQVINPAWDVQLQQNLIGDVYSGYMGSPTPFLGNQNNMTYALVDNWNGQPWGDAYNGVMQPVQLVFKNAGTQYPAFVAWARILRVEGMHRLSDIFGPIIYTHYGQLNADGSSTYDSQKDAYYAFFSDLDSALTVLTPLAQSGATPTFTNFDLVYGGDYKEWVKFANSLKLRLALRIVNVDPAKAKAEGEAALANPIGLLSTNADGFTIDIGSTQHPLNTINNSWGDIRFGAPLGSYLNGYNDPRTSKYAQPATDPAVLGKVIGVRNGIDIDAKGRYENYSTLPNFPNYGATAWGSVYSKTNYVQLMTAAEVWFLKAEAALRGWAGAGDITTDYNTGITTSFNQYGLDAAATAYINDATSKAQPYVDPKATVAGHNDVLAGNADLSTITIKWDNAATFAQKLERIITQKYLSMYPDGEEAWAEFRRTGYPKLFHNTVNFSNGTIPTAKFVRRVNFPLSERNTNPVGEAAAVKLLNGADVGGTPLWWDVN